MKKRILSLLMVLVLVISMLSGFTFAESTGAGTEESPYQIGDTVANDGSAEPAGYTVPDSYWARSDIPASEKLVCELQNHSHSVEEGCIEQTPAYTLWTLTENVNVNDDEGENENDEDNAEGGLMFAPAPAAENNQGALPIHFFLASPGNITNPDGTYTNYYVPLQDSNNAAWTIPNIKQDSNWRQINTKDGIRNVYDESIVTQYVASWPNGGAAAFKDFGTVTISGRTYSDTEYEIKWVSIMCRETGRLNCNQWSNYSGEHIHIDGLLVEKIQPGEMEVYKAIPAALTTGTTFQFTLQKMLQANLTTPPSSSTAVDTSFAPMTLTASIPAGEKEAQISGGSDISFGYYKLTENGSDDWQMSGVKLTDNNNRSQTIETDALYICIAPNGTVQYSTSPSGPYTTMKKVTVENERKPVNVSYEWRVINEHGFSTELPAGAPNVPVETSQAYGSQYVYDTEFVEGSSFSDYDTGLLYTFRGWDVYSHSDTFNVYPSAQYIALDDGDQIAGNNKTIPMTADTYIYGYWEVSQMPPASAHIAVEKVFKLDGVDVTDEISSSPIAEAKNVLFHINPGIDLDEDGVYQVEITYPMILAQNGEYKLAVYQYATPFTFTELNADIPGFTRTTEIAVTDGPTDGVTAALIRSNDVYAEVELNEVYEGTNVHLGTITYTNNYTKKIGTPVTEYPTLSLVKRATDTGLLQANAEFTVYSDAACKNPIAAFTTNGEGVASIDFKTIIGNKTGSVTVYLKETDAPAGYLVDSSVYTLTLTPSTSEELRGDEFVVVTAYALSIGVPANSGAEPVQNAADELKYSLNVFNRPIFGQVTVNKTAAGLAEADKELLEATVTVHGPLVRNAEGTITSLGNEHTLILNQENEWTMTQAQLPIGEYLIHENLAHVHGYTWDMSNVSYGTLEKEVYNNITSGVFKITDTDADIEITIANTYEKWESAGFEIYKIDPSGVHLSGVSFQLYSDEACTTAATGSGITTNAVTGANGLAWFGGFTVPAEDPDGMVTYYLKETETKAGYYLSNTVYRVDIKAVTDGEGTTSFEPKISVKLNGAWEAAAGFSNTSDVLTVVNNPVLGQITITKEMTGAPADLNSISFYVYGPNGYAKTVELTRSGNWTATLTGLSLGEYTIIEQKADAPGYDLVTTYEVNGVETGDKATVVLSETTPGKTPSNTVFAGEAEITNTYTRRETIVENPTSLIVRKVGEDGRTPLAGAVFTLVRDRDNTAVSYTTNANGEVQFSFLAGTIENGQIKEGKYTLTETTAPEGYAATATQWKITVSEDNGEVTIKLNENTNIFENIWDWIIGGITDGEKDYSFENNVLTVVNVELADMTISKSFDGATPSEGAVIEVAVFDSKGVLVKQVELSEDNNWTDTLENIPADTYTVRETSPSLHGYTWKSAEFTVSGVAAEDVTTASASVTVKVADSADIAVAIENSYTEWESADFYVLKTKTDGRTPLQGAVFTLYDSTGADVTGNYLHVDDSNHANNGNVTGPGGILHFHGFEVEAGQKAVFTLKETAPANYYANENVYHIVVDHTNDAYDISITRADGAALTVAADKASFNYANDVLTVVNEEILADLVITKTFSDASDLVPISVKVDITGPGGYSNTVTLGTHNNYQVTIEGLSLGEYSIKEQDASQNGYALTVKYNGYIRDQATVTLTKDNDNTAAEVEIENTYLLDKHNPANFTVKKIDSETKEPLEGAVFGLFDSTGAPVGEEKTTGADGEVTFGPFSSAAEYTLKEISAPVNYELSDVTWKVTVKEDDGQVMIQLDHDRRLYENIWDWIVDLVSSGQTAATWKDGVLTVPNTIKTGALTISKAVVDTLGHYADAEKEYSFTLTLSDRTDPVTFTLKKDETKLIENIPYGTTYTLTEDTAEAVFVSEIVDSGNGRIAADDTEIQVTNTYRYVGNNPGLNLLKVDADKTEQPLANAGFTLYSDEACETALGTEVFSDETGKVHLDIAEKGTYYLKETTAPEGYYLDDTVYTVTAEENLVVKNAGTADAITEIQMIISIAGLTASEGVYTIRNTAIKPVEVSVRKIWYGAGVAYPDSIKVVLYRDGEAYDSVVLSEENNWRYTWKNLTDEYEWTVDEPSVPSGYTKYVRANGDYSFSIINTHTDIPKTGDITNMLGLGLLSALGIAGFCTTAVLLLRPKKKSKSG